MMIEFLIGIIIGLVLGFMYLVHSVKVHVKNQEKIKIYKTIDTGRRIEPNLSIELVNNVYLVYNEKTSEFVCQGNTHAEIEERLLFNKISDAVLVDKNNIDSKFYIFKDGKLETVRAV